MPEKFTATFEKTPESKLVPESIKERELWEKELNGADKPVVNFLKRINRLLGKEFPDSEIQSDSSCSGHAKTDGSMEYEIEHPKFPRKVPIEKVAFVDFLASADKISAQQRKKIDVFLNKVFLNAVQVTNESLKSKSISLDNGSQPKPLDTYSADETEF